MQNNSKQWYYNIKKITLIIFTCFALVGCGNGTSSNLQTFWDGKQYIAVGDDETVITSSEGMKWTANKS